MENLLKYECVLVFRATNFNWNNMAFEVSDDVLVPQMILVKKGFE